MPVSVKEHRGSSILSKITVMLIFALMVAQQVDAGRISGIVRNAQSGRAIADVFIEIEGTGYTTVSDSTGVFRFDSIQPGSCNLLFFHQRMEPLRINDVFIAGSAIKYLDIEMNPQLVSLDTLTVRGTAFRKPPDMASSAKIMSFDEILRSPGALVDVQRAVQNLPSVSSAGDNTNEIIVRGGNRGENLLIMDNIEIPNPNHFADQGSGGGVVSLINPLLVKGLTFSAGAPPAQYGGKASSVLDVRLREGNNKMVLGGVDIGVAGAGLHIEGPLWKNATFMASASKSYLDLFTHFSPSTAVPSFFGGQAKITQTLGKHTLSFNCIGGKNSIHFENAEEEIGSDGDRITAGGIIYASGVNWKTAWTDRLSTVVTVSAVGNSFERLEYSDTSSVGRSEPDTFFVNTSFEREQMLKGIATIAIGEKHQLSAGIGAKRCTFDGEIHERPYAFLLDSIDREIIADSDSIAYKGGAFISAILYPFEKLKIIPGVRCDYFTWNRSTTVAPRLGVVYSFLPQLELTSSGGLQFQEPDYSLLAADSHNHSLKAKRVGTGIVGAEYTLEKFAARFIIEAFYKRFDRAPIRFELTTVDPFDKSDRYVSKGEGYSYGFELFAHKKLTNHLFGTFAYSRSRSWQYDIRPGHKGKLLPGDFDFRNIFTITGGYKLDLIEKEWYKKIHHKWWMIACSPILPIADRIEISAKWRYLGGRPYTEKVYYDEQMQFIDREDDYLGERYPNYHRLDIRFERRYGFGFLRMIYYFDFQNVYNRANIWNYMYSDRRQTKKEIWQFPFFPAGGVIIGF